MALIHIYCGDGKGKTTASVGLAIRALGSNMKVVFCQFFKNGNSCEINALQTFENLIYKKSDKDFPFFSVMTDGQKSQAKDHFSALFNEVISVSNECDMIIFDEIISTYNFNFLDKKDVIDKIKNASKTCEIVLTGRNPADELCQIADYISFVKKIKHPYDEGISARKGIEF